MHVGSAEVGGLVEVVEHDPGRDMAWVSVVGIDQRGRWRLRRRRLGRAGGPGRRARRVELRLSYGVAGSGIFGWLAEHVAAPTVRGNLQRSLQQLKRQVEHEQLRSRRAAARRAARVGLAVRTRQMAARVRARHLGRRRRRRRCATCSRARSSARAIASRPSPTATGRWRRPGRGQFDVILLDVALGPGPTGYDVARALRARRNVTPVIMLTALDSEADAVQGLEAGADDYVTKPFGLAELRSRASARSCAAPAATCSTTACWRSAPSCSTSASARSRSTTSRCA